MALSLCINLFTILRASCVLCFFQSDSRLFNNWPLKTECAHSVNNCAKFPTIITIIPSERYAPQNWLCGLTLAHAVWHSKLKANQTDIALNTVLIFSPYLEMFTSSWWLTEVGRVDVSHFSCIRLSRGERRLLSDCHSVNSSSLVCVSDLRRNCEYHVCVHF